eukprot:183319-Rhodomonas_salina.2
MERERGREGQGEGESRRGREGGRPVEEVAGHGGADDGADDRPGVYTDADSEVDVEASGHAPKDLNDRVREHGGAVLVVVAGVRAPDDELAAVPCPHRAPLCHSLSRARAHTHTGFLIGHL